MEDIDAPKAKRRPQWVPLLAGVVVAVVIGVGFMVPTVKTVPGVVTASATDVSAYAEEVKAAAEAKKDEEERANIASLEAEVRDDMRNYFAGGGYGYPEEQVTVSKVTLVKTGDAQYEGTAMMSARGGPEHSILLHVTADSRSLLWKTDEGALLPLFR